MPFIAAHALVLIFGKEDSIGHKRSMWEGSCFRLAKKEIFLALSFCHVTKKDYLLLNRLYFRLVRLWLGLTGTEKVRNVFGTHSEVICDFITRYWEWARYSGVPRGWGNLITVITQWATEWICPGYSSFCGVSAAHFITIIVSYDLWSCWVWLKETSDGVRFNIKVTLPGVCIYVPLPFLERALYGRTVFFIISPWILMPAEVNVWMKFIDSIKMFHQYEWEWPCRSSLKRNKLVKLLLSDCLQMKLRNDSSEAEILSSTFPSPHIKGNIGK